MSLHKARAAVLAFVLASAAFSSCRSPVAPDDDDDPAPSADATLSSLAITANGSSVAIAFSSAILSYAVNVPTATTTVSLSATASDSGATVTGTGDVTLGAAGTSTTRSIVVTAADATTEKTYTVTINRAAVVASSDATLSDLVVRLPGRANVPENNLLASFDPETYAYTLVPVINETSSLVISATANDAGASVAIPDAPLSVGANTFNVVVTAADGVAKKTYSITIERYGPESDELASLALAELPSFFADGVVDYSINVPNDRETVTITATKELDGSTWEISTDTGIDFVTFAGSETVALVAGTARNVTIRVTAEFSGASRDYTLHILRASPGASTITTLSGLTVVDSNGDAVALSPGFSSDQHLYTATVPSTVASLAVTATATVGDATVLVSGADSIETGSANTVTITVTAADGSTTGTYTIAVTRREYPVITISDPVQDEQISAGAFSVTGTYVDADNELESIVAMFGGATYTGTMISGNFSIDIDASGATNGSKSLIVLGYPESGLIPAAVAMTDVIIISGATGYNVSCSVVLPDNANTLASGYMTMCLVSGESLVEVDWDIDVRGITFPYQYTFHGVPAGSYSIIVEVVDDEFVNALFVGESSAQTVSSGPRNFGSVYLTEYVPE